MPCRLIVNADDFGLTRGINRAVAELYQAGVVTSTTLMATGAAFDHAATVAAYLPGLGVGCHIVLVDGTPLLPPGDISSLLGGDRKTLRPTLGGFVADLLRGGIREDEIEAEAEAQIRRLQQSGIRVTHVDTHKHTHMFPQVARPVLRAARRCGVRAMRKPFEPRWSRSLSRASLTRRLQLAALSRLEPSFLRCVLPNATEATTNGTLGIAATGCLDAPVLRSTLGAALTHDEGNPVYELVCHPGYHDEDLARANTRLLLHREIERSALLREIPTCAELKLMHYGDLRQ